MLGIGQDGGSGVGKSSSQSGIGHLHHIQRLDGARRRTSAIAGSSGPPVGSKRDQRSDRKRRVTEQQAKK